jgi:sigma-B regulation protein RsbU (phosphoserine phosphatase)
MPPLGVVALPYADDDSQRYTLATGDILVAITDGFYEAADPARVLFDEDRIREIVRGARDRTAREILDAIKREVHAFTQHAPLEDDQTGLIIKRL